MIKILGIAASPGVAIGKVRKVDTNDIIYRQGVIDANEMTTQRGCLTVAIQKARAQLAEIICDAGCQGETERAEIIEAQAMMLEDKSFTDKMYAYIENEGYYPETAVLHVSNEYKALFEQMDDAYLRERASDVEDICLRIVKNILGLPQSVVAGEDETEDEPIILFARILLPTDSGNLNPNTVAAICMQEGGATSHSVIIARMRGIPAVTGLHNVLAEVKDGDTVIVDGDQGFVLINPDADQIEAYQRKREEQIALREGMSAMRSLPAITADGKCRVELAANIMSINDMDAAIENGAESIGLYRSEFLYAECQILPSEEDQYKAYRAIVEKMSPKPVIIRTLDVGGDKKMPCFDLPDEENPFMGWRGIRISLDDTELFCCQLRAILRASAHGEVRIMFPMITTLDELREANRLVDVCKTELKNAQIPYDESIETGIMIETPAAAISADILIEETDFFSIGSNDLVQYTMVADRMNDKVAKLCNPMDISVLRLIRNIIDAAHKEGKWVGICGEMAGNPAFTSLLLGLGIDELSMNAPSIPAVKSVVCNATLKEAETAVSMAFCDRI